MDPNQDVVPGAQHGKGPKGHTWYMVCGTMCMVYGTCYNASYMVLSL